MTIQVNVHEAKTRLSELLQAVERGEEVIIARAGKPVVRLSRFQTADPANKRKLGWLAKAGPSNMTNEEWLSMDRELDAEVEAMLAGREIPRG